MANRRVYLGLGPDHLAAFIAGESLTNVDAAHAVTEALTQANPRAGDDELEALAWAATARETPASGDSGRRVIASADVPAEAVGPRTGDDSAVTVLAPIEPRCVVSFHVDEEPDAAGTADLLWYDATEAADVARLVGP